MPFESDLSYSIFQHCNKKMDPFKTFKLFLVWHVNETLWDHVYNPTRLQIVERCKTVTGTIDSIKDEADGVFYLKRVFLFLVGLIRSCLLSSTTDIGTLVFIALVTSVSLHVIVVTFTLLLLPLFSPVTK
jgi:hypothetical protein